MHIVDVIILQVHQPVILSRLGLHADSLQGKAEVKLLDAASQVKKIYLYLFNYTITCCRGDLFRFFRPYSLVIDAFVRFLAWEWKLVSSIFTHNQYLYLSFEHKNQKIRHFNISFGDSVRGNATERFKVL